ncbi:MAG: hypothetical protein QW040_00490 [Candidatus Aenigmatarchaeota archaeon]
MAEQTFWIVAALVIIIVVAVAVIALFGGQFGPFKTWIFRITGHQELCREMNVRGCINAYMPNLEYEKSGIFYDQIGKRLPDPNNRNADINKATFGEVCEFFEYKNFDLCLKSCNCQVT